MIKKINIQKIKDFTLRFFCILLALILTQLNTPRAFAAVEDFLDKFAANNIMFYNPDECNGEGNNSGSTVLSGADTKEKIWNFFIGKGLNDIQVAGIMGNALGESGAVITAASNGNYWGIFQFSRQYYDVPAGTQVPSGYLRPEISPVPHISQAGDLSSRSF